MAPTTRRRKTKRPNYNEAEYFAQAGIDLEEEVSTGEGDEDRPKPKRRRMNKTTGSPSSSDIVPKTVRTGKLAENAANIPDIWYLVFQYFLAAGDRTTVARCIILNKHIGSVAARLIYRGGTQHTAPAKLVHRARSIYRSVYDETAFRYCDTVNELDMNDIARAIVQDEMNVEDFYRLIAEDVVPSRIILPTLTSANLAAVSDSVALWMCRHKHHFPVLQTMGAKSLGLGLVAPAAFGDIVTLKLSASVIDEHAGVLIAAGCSRLRNLAVSYAFNNPDFIGFVSAPNALPAVEETRVGKGVRGFLLALPSDMLKGFEMCLHNPKNQDENFINRDRVGLGYSESRMLLQDLQHHTGLEALKLARMDPCAYVDLTRLQSLPNTLISLHLIMPDGAWGSRSLVPCRPPPFLELILTPWLQRCRNLVKLHWRSMDERTPPRYQIGPNWADIIARALPLDDTEDHFANLEEAVFELGVSRRHIYLSIRHLRKLKFLQIIADPFVSPNNHGRLRQRLKLETEFLAGSVVESPSLEWVSIQDANFCIGNRAFSFPKVSAKRSGPPPASNPKLRHLTIRTFNNCTNEIGMWKFLSRLPELAVLHLDTDNDWKPEDVYTFLKKSNLPTKLASRNPRRFHLCRITAGPWEKVTIAQKRLFEQYLDLRLENGGVPIIF